MTAEPVLLIEEPHPGVRVLTLNRPERLNALNGELTSTLADTIQECDGDDSIKTIVIRANGRAFCAGADLKWLAEGTLKDHHLHLAFQDNLERLCNSIEACSQIVVGVIQGYALAGGMEVALACDMLLVNEAAEMGDEHINRNLIAGGGGSQRLPRKIGLPRGLYYLLSGKRMTGAQAAEFGLACAAVPKEELDDTAMELALGLAKTDPKALSMTKDLIRRGFEMPLKDGLWLERWVQHKYRSASAAMDKGITDFAEKRT